VARLLCAVSLALSIAGTADADAETPYSIQSVRAHFYYQGSGTFSDRDLFDPTLVLRNTIGGAGDAREASGAVLVLVKMTGSFLAEAKGTIELDASADGQKFPRQSIPLNTLFSETGTATAPFLIYDSPCWPLTLEIRFVGVPGKPASVTRTIPFQCGE
jgi:hypothetical protein